MKITVLCENTTWKRGILAEHGLSLYIETGGRKLLFDMGQTDVFCRNASALGIDLAEVDTAVLSHGHNDHGGGLGTFLRVNSKAPVYLSRLAFGDYLNASGLHIGLDRALQNSGRLVFTDDEAQIGEGLSLYSCNDCGFEVASGGMSVSENGVLSPDGFLHEQYLLINESGKSVLISGCSHKGVLNLEKRFKPDVFVGGFHFMGIGRDVESLEKLRRTMLSLACCPTRFYTCHCTGIEQYAGLSHYMGPRLLYISAGDSFVL